MLANRPACIRQGWPSSVWIRLGLSASFNSTVVNPGGAEVLGGHQAAVVGVGHGDGAEPRTQVVEVPRHRKDGHHLGGGGDVQPDSRG